MDNAHYGPSGVQAEKIVINNAMYLRLYLNTIASDNYLQAADFHQPTKNYHRMV